MIEDTYFKSTLATYQIKTKWDVFNHEPWWVMSYIQWDYIIRKQKSNQLLKLEKIKRLQFMYW